MKLKDTTPEIILKIQSEIANMSPAMQKLAQFIIDNFGSLDGIMIQEMARRSGVSEATITRFTKSIGFPNYQAMIFQITRENHDRLQHPIDYTWINEQDDVENMCQKIFAVNNQTLIDTLSILDFEALKAASDAVISSKRIAIYAQGRSVVPASSVCQRLRRLGFFPTLYEDAHDGAVASAIFSKGDVVIGISTYGRTSMVVRNLERARKNGATTIVLTSYCNTPIERTADIILRTVNNEDRAFGHEPSCATVSQIVVLDCMYNLIYMSDKTQNDRLMIAAKEALESEKV